MVKLRIVTRENWERALLLKVNNNQKKFAPEVALSLAKVYIKPDGDQVEYIPFAIYDGEQMVGFIMHAFEENTSDMYWINGFLIDKGCNRLKKGAGSNIWVVSGGDILSS
jgi:diamine N-acetyltransferase